MSTTKEGKIWVVICNSTSKLCSKEGKTVYWNSQEEASNFIQADGYEVEFYMDENNQHTLVEYKSGMNVDKN